MEFPADKLMVFSQYGIYSITSSGNNSIPECEFNGMECHGSCI